MDLPLPIVDANIARVLARLFYYQKEIDSTEGRRQLWEWAAALVPQENSGAYNSAIMELGQRICTSRQPQCQNCPVAKYCRSLGNHPQNLPIKKERRKTVFLTEHVAWVSRGGKLLLKQETGNRRQGLWKLPERPEATFSESLAPLVHSSQYTITHHRVSLQVYEMSNLKPQSDESWHPLGTLPHLPMPSPYRRVVQALLEP
jgi:A/G-specific adenine glycosylase